MRSLQKLTKRVQIRVPSLTRGNRLPANRPALLLLALFGSPATSALWSLSGQKDIERFDPEIVPRPSCPRSVRPGASYGMSPGRSPKGLLALFFDFLLFVVIHFFDCRVLISRAGCLSSCGWGAGVRNRRLLRTRFRRSRCRSVGWVCLGDCKCGRGQQQYCNCELLVHHFLLGILIVTNPNRIQGSKFRLYCSIRRYRSIEPFSAHRNL